MYFQIMKIILWPRKQLPPHTVDFHIGSVNVISGASKTGKSAVIPIIDYCLASEKCAIPVGIIRETCGWFGILIDTVEGQKILARREPGDQQSTGDMVLIEGVDLEIPQRITAKTHTVSDIKLILDRLSGLTNLSFETGEFIGYGSRPSFRDLMAFCFQPQNIIANPDVMFFKADTTEHREKLKFILPYVLGAVTPEVLQARFELERLNRLLRRKESELRNLREGGEAWRREAQGWLTTAIEFGLLPAGEILPSDWPDTVDLLRKVTRTDAHLAKPSIEGLDEALNRLEDLRSQEAKVAEELSLHRQQMNDLRRLVEGSEAYGGAIRVQRDRLALSEWLSKFGDAGSLDPLATLAEGGATGSLEELCAALRALEIKLRTQPDFSEALDRELLRQRSATERVLVELNGIRRDILNLERESDEVATEVSRFERIERFLGRIEQALEYFDLIDGSDTLQEEVLSLQKEIQRLQQIVSERDIRRRIDSALDRIQASIGRMIPRLDAEWPDAAVQFIISELTVKIIQSNRDDYLWEIGSGANWLAYHVALSLAFQWYFLSEAFHPVPALLIYDQPSQVYFPKRAVRRDDDETEGHEVPWKDEDVEAVRKVFALLASAASAAKGRLQIIVLDHADEGVWGPVDGLVLVDEWRGKALVPSNWI